MIHVANRKTLVQIGMELNDAHDKGKPQEELCTFEESDSPELKKLKSTITKMAAYDPEDRYKAVKVEEILGNITGKNSICHLPK